MKLKRIDAAFSVCRLADASQVRMDAGFCFFSRTDEELSLVCETAAVPENVLAREDGWRALRIEGTLDFSLIGILARISSVLAENGIGIFAISTYNTDYILTKEENFLRTLAALENAGYELL